MKGIQNIMLLGACIVLFSCNNGEKQNQTQPAEQNEQNVQTEQVNQKKTRSQIKQDLTTEEMTADAGLSAEEVEALYNDPVENIDGKERALNSLSLYDYIELKDEYSAFQRFLQKNTKGKSLLQNSDRKLVVFAPTDDLLKSENQFNALNALSDSKDHNAKLDYLYKHVFALEGKYIGGDFIYISDLRTGKKYQLRNKKGWSLKDAQLGDPKLFHNGMLFEIQNNLWVTI